MKLKYRFKSFHFWMIVIAVLIILSALLFKFTNLHFFYVLSIIWFTPLALYIIFSVIFAWIINPIMKYLINKK